MTTHLIQFQNASRMSSLKDERIDLVVTSPPYPMIGMWDEIMSLQNPRIGELLTVQPAAAFELMHQELDKVWNECYRVLNPGGFMCINIGDATRTINGEFALFNNHSRIVRHCIEIGFTNLPNIIWRKQTNSPNKFMGSGMLPCGAYVTLEHEWILVFRKGSKRAYKSEDEKEARRSSSYFWEERNQWFSDLWDLKGVKQAISNSHTRERSAAYPLALPYRVINMYSQRGDTVLDPFIGLGTTMVAAMLSERNCIGYEIDEKLRNAIKDNIQSFTPQDMNNYILKRYSNHIRFVRERKDNGKEVKYYNKELECDVMTKQEQEMSLHFVDTIIPVASPSLAFRCSYMEKTKLTQIESIIGGLFANSTSMGIA